MKSFGEIVIGTINQNLFTERKLEYEINKEENGTGKYYLG